MPNRRTPYPAARAGAVLRQWRGARSLQTVCRWLKANERIDLDPSALSKYERGRYPPPHLLYGLAALYKRPLSSLVRLYLPEGVRVAPIPDRETTGLSAELQLLDLVLRDVAQDRRLPAALKGAEAIAAFVKASH